MSEIKNQDDKLNKSMTREEKKAARKAERLKDKERIAEEKRKDREERFKIEDPIGFMKIINIISIILVVIALFFGVRYLINMAFVSSYNHGDYKPKVEEFLSKLNIPEGYLPHYNAGNAYYKLEDYDSAISCYQSALDSHPTEKKECDIRVNLALAMLHKIDFDNIDTEKQKANAVRQLQSARNVLVEKGCADPYGTNGHDPEAEQLKQDIDKMLEELGAEPEPPNNENDQQQQGKGGDSEEKQKSRREQQLEKDLNKQKQNAMEERQEADQQQQYKNDNGSSGQSSGDGSQYGEDSDMKSW
ncbi:MAG: tetratricopeptide repeat protein [Eubacterium sp.]|nr:tetratricopeptide repeat protein [Eubacterium sp.]